MFDINLQASAVAGQPVLEMLTGVDESLAGGDQVPVYGLCDADLEAAFEACQSAQARLFGMLLGLVREADERDLGRRQGGASTAAWLAGRFRLRPGQARTLVRLARRAIAADGFEHNHGISHRVLVTIGRTTLTAEHPHPRTPHRQRQPHRRRRHQQHEQQQHYHRCQRRAR